MFPNILCDKCHAKKASVTLTKITNGKVTELHLCQECASTVSPFQKKLLETQQNIGQILSSLLGQKDEKSGQKIIKEKLQEKELFCSFCKLPFSDYKKTYFLGCPKCYDSFGESILIDIRRIHGTTYHFKDVEKEEMLGKIEEVTETIESAEEIKDITPENNLEKLYEMLEDAINSERFEDAARLRDEIKKIKGNL